MSLDKKVLYKLKSQEGASITFALLIFLVCAVLSSVIITAATAASGRMANMARSDRNYYAVTSAAELLKDTIDGTTVTVERKEVTGSSPSDTTDITISQGVQTDGNTIFAEDAVFRLVDTSKGPAITNPFSRELTMTLKGGDGSKIPVKLNETISPATSSGDSKIEFVLKNSDESDNLPYTMTVTFDVDIEKGEEVVTYDDGDIKKTSKITYVTFYYKDIK